MERRKFLKFAGLLPVIGIFKGDSIFGMTQSWKTLTCLPDKIASLDLIFSEVQKKSLVVIGSRPNMGKSALMINLLDYYTITKKQKVVFFSLEQNKENLVKRWFNLKRESYPASNDKVEERHDLTNEELSIFDAINNSEAHFDYALVSVQEIRRKVEKVIKNGQKIEFVFVDYLQLVGNEDNYPSRLAAIQDTLLKLKSMAMELDLVVILSAQLNRGVENRAASRPIPSDLRELRDLSQIDELILLYRDRFDEGSATKIDLEFLKYKKGLLRFHTFAGKLNLITHNISSITEI